MENTDNKGQILIEVCLVMSLIFLIFFAAISQITELKSTQRKHQFIKEKSYVSKDTFPATK